MRKRYTIEIKVEIDVPERLQEKYPDADEIEWYGKRLCLGIMEKDYLNDDLVLTADVVDIYEK